jgi:sugar lactone lactonase YvrE
MRTINRRRTIAAISTALAAGALLVVAPAGAALAGGAPAARFPTTIDLPVGAPPEGIAIDGRSVYVSNRVTGAIFKADLKTGRGAVLTPGPGTPSLGLKVDRRGRLFVAGGTGGDGRVLDARTGKLLASYPFATGPSFVNDEVVTDDAVWFTDSTNPVLYKLPLGRHGALPPQSGVVKLPLTGDLVFTTGTNANGIVTTPDGRGLIVVQSNTGKLFRVDPRTGVTRTVDLGAESVPNGDGLLRVGRTLYVVQNRLNVVAVLRLNRAGTAATVRTRLTDPRLDVPSTVARFDGRLYLPNARFTTPVTPTTTYSVNAIPIR